MSKFKERKDIKFKKGRDLSNLWLKNIWMVEAKFCSSWSDNVNLIGQKMSVLSIGHYDFLNSLQNLSDVNARD